MRGSYGWIDWTETNYQTVAAGGSFPPTSCYRVKDLLKGCGWVFGRPF
ncbi:MAG: hypothetical protein NTV33_12720 [Coprothermobacterota bacterium]|nr:hypothetical protein [Coprothermobacterota bacterium]